MNGNSSITKFLYQLSLVFLIGLAACQSNQGADDNTNAVTPPVVAESTDRPPPTAVATATAMATDSSPATAAPEETPTAPVAPTAVPTQPEATATDTPAAATAVTGIQLEPVVANGLSQPTYLTHAFDERLFVTEQEGRIRIIENGQLRQTPFLDIVDRVGSNASEQGLLSVAFHPQYANRDDAGNGRFFVNYTDNNGDTVVSRYQVQADNPNQADPASEVVILTIAQPFGNHNGGQLQFGPDGYLYIGMGDGGSGGDPRGHGQDRGTLLGALLRLDVDQAESGANYGIPASNPFVDDESGRNEIWAIGLRNPWRFSFDRLTDDLYIADVGQNAWEEVNFQAADSSGGENYGWNIMEGNHCFRASDCDMTGLELPVFEYTRDNGCSVSGGYVYRGQQFPSLSGNYFVGDFCSGIIWSLLRQPDGNWTATQVLASDINISSFGQDLAGELYVLDHNGGVYQLRP